MRANSSKNKSNNNKRSELLPSNSSVQVVVPSYSSGASTRSQQETNSTQPPTRLVFGLSSRTNKLKHDEYAERRSQIKSPSAVPNLAAAQSATLSTAYKTPAHSPTTSGKKVHTTTSDKTRVAPDAPSRAPTSAIRASKYGDFYKPHNMLANEQQARGATSNKPLTRSRSKSPVRVNYASPNVIVKTPATTLSSNNQMKELEETKQIKQTEGAVSEPQLNSNSNNNNTAKRMQFNIPPPPKVGGASITGKSSMVSYAKSRIYDRQSKPAALGEKQSLLDSSTIPEAILSGFKPPKQVNVSKAREKWEGGEPFAKCKSRQRLQAAQAGKKLHGAWPMASMVATQQLQLQQQASSGPRPLFGASSTEFGQPVKVLTRGSVLERVQKFEKVPGTPNPLLTSEVDPQDAEIFENGSPSSTDKESIQQPSLEGQVLLTSSSVTLNGAAQQSTNPLAFKQSAVELLTKSTPISSNNRRSSLTLGRRSSASSNSSTSCIPKFYHPNGKPNTYEIELQKKNIVAAFDKLPDRKAQLTGSACRRHFHAIALACGFSEYFKEPLFLYVKHQLTESNLLHNMQRQHRASGAGFANGIQLTSPQPLIRKSAPTSLIRAASIDNSTMEKLQNQNYISCDQFLVCWRNIISCAFDNPARFVHLLTLGKRNYLLPDDFIPLIQSIIDEHPGLKFLRSAPDFHMRYIQTVIARIYFCINKSWTGKISLTELRKSNLLNVLKVLSIEEDINHVSDYFSYEHFYVIYCKFWSLDQDHDLLLSKEDLAKHNDAAISSRIIDRIFMGIVSKHIQEKGTMSYSDFVWFLIAEEDKKHPRSIEYWFRLMDIDGDGYISMYEMEYLYYEQMKRLELMNIEPLPFLDSACQVLDLVNPKEKNKISLSDLKRTKLAPIFFDTFINLEKYLEHESREFVSSRDVTLDGMIISDWERYANEEYESLVSEETSV